MIDDVVLPDLDSIPTQPPPPIPRGEAEYPERRPRAPRPRTGGGRLWRLLVLILAGQASLVTSAVLVAVERPSLAWAVSAVAITDAFMVVCFSMVLGVLGRNR